MKILRNHSIRYFNSFGIDVLAEELAILRSEQEVSRFFGKKNAQQVRILGGGSNILFTRAVDGLLVKNEIPGRKIVKRLGSQVIVEVGAGENWHEFVLWTLSQGLYGLENLSLIPGTVGASPIQNIGAYGVELWERFDSLDAIDMDIGEKRTFGIDECAFSYRNSIFKDELKGRYLITRVRLKLSEEPDLRLNYGAIRETLKEGGVVNPTPEDVSKAVIRIRSSKLPDPAKLGNAGSFFKNPELPNLAYQKLLKQFPEMPAWPMDEGTVKIPAAWLIDRAGWKGKRIGDAGVHENHALVLVNYGRATGAQIAELAQAIQSSVKDLYDISLTPEVNIW